MNNKEIIDVEDVMERVQDDWELFLELLDIFTKDFLEKKEKLLVYMDQKDIEKIKEIIHSIKGASGNISAKAIYAACVQVEDLAEQQDIDGVIQAFGELEKNFLAVQEYIVEIKEGGESKFRL